MQFAGCAREYQLDVAAGVWNMIWPRTQYSTRS